jgi:DNA-binding CsgD family transcriptional regulator
MADSGLDADTLRVAALSELKQAVGFDRWVWRLVDPASSLFTSGVGEHDLWDQVAELARLEQCEESVNTLRHRVQGPRATDSLVRAAGGDHARSARWDRVLRHAGIGDEVRSASIDAGRAWADLHLWRGASDQPFDADELDLIDDVATLIAPALRRSAALPTAPAAPTGVLIFDASLRPRSWTDGAGTWLEAHDAGTVPGMRDAAGALAVVARLMHEREVGAAESSARVRLHTRTGWVVIEGSSLQGADAGGIAVTIRPTTPADYLDLVCLAYELTPRERELVEMLVQGADTKQIARGLFISPHTVQDHLKSVFAKVGVRSRRELVARLDARSPDGRTLTAQSVGS